MVDAVRSVVRHVGIVGGGAIGCGIAVDLALHGRQVSVHNRSAAGSDRARSRIGELLTRLVEVGLATGDQVDAALAAVATTTALDAVAAADYVVEAVPEDPDLKRQVLATLDAAAAPDVVLASATTALPITELAAGCRRPERVLGTHYSLPAHLIPVVVVVPGERTAPDAVTVASTLLASLGKSPVVLDRDRPGTIGPRLQTALIGEALRLVADGVDPTTIDQVLTGGIGRRFGISGVFDRLDLAGLDTVAAVLTRQGRPVPPPIAEKLAAGHLGRKSGHGFYPWPADRAEAYDKLETRHLAAYLLRERHAAGTGVDPAGSSSVGSSGSAGSAGSAGSGSAAAGSGSTGSAAAGSAAAGSGSAGVVSAGMGSGDSGTGGSGSGDSGSAGSGLTGAASSGVGSSGSGSAGAASSGVGSSGSGSAGAASGGAGSGDPGSSGSGGAGSGGVGPALAGAGSGGPSVLPGLPQVQRPVLVEPGALDDFFAAAVHEYRTCTPELPPRCFAVLVGTVDHDVIRVRRAHFADSVRAEDPSADAEWSKAIVPCFGSAYANDRRGFWCSPADLLHISRQADADGLDVLGSVHLHPDWHHIGPPHERGLRISEEPTPMDGYLFGRTGWPVNLICYLEDVDGSADNLAGSSAGGSAGSSAHGAAGGSADGSTGGSADGSTGGQAGGRPDRGSIGHTMAAWAPPPVDDPAVGCVRLPLLQSLAVPVSS